VSLDAPDGTTLQGNCAEWILEDLGDGNGAQFPMTRYGTTYFDNCYACTSNSVDNLANADPTIMVQGGNNVSVATMETDVLVKLTYTGS
jgi:cytochrome c1